MDGVEFGLTITGNTAITAGDRVYVASSRPGVDYLFYKIGNGDWQPYQPGNDTPLTAGAALTPFTHSISVSATSHEMRLKIVSTVPGTSQIAFGTNAQDAQEYANGRMPSNSLIFIINQRKFDATFISVSASEQLLLYVDGYYNYGYGSPTTPSAGEKNMAASADQKLANNADAYLLNAMLISNGVPAGGRDVFFSVQSGSGVTLSASKSTTTASGRAETRISANAAGTVDILARASGVAEQIGAGIRRDLVSLIFSASSNVVAGNIVQGLRLETISAGVKLRWDTLSGGVGYRVYRSQNANEDGLSLTEAVVTGNEFIDVGVLPNTIYYYAVRQVVRGANASTGQREEVGPATNKVAVTTPSSILGQNLTAPSAGAVKKSMLMALNAPGMNVFGNLQEIDPGRDTTPLLRKDRTMVPIRAIVEAMGGSAGWEESNRQITLQYRQNTVFMWVDSYNITVNGVQKTMDVAPTIINGRTMVPLRFAAENLGCEVEWLGDTQQIVIVYY